MKVIKTNLSMPNGVIVDHQSYVTEEESWGSFVEKVKSGHLFSNNHREKRVENIVYDDFHLSCDVYDSHGLTKHLAIIDGYVKAID